MKFLIIFALALSTASAFSISNSKLGIINGIRAATGQFPYQVGIYLDFSPTEGGWCGGSLIGYRWVITTAHCTKDALTVTVYLGGTKKNEPEIEHTVRSNKITSHPDFNKSNFNNDIALIKIPFTAYTDNIKSVKLPSISSPYPTYDGFNVIITGWGLFSDSANDTTNDLLWAPIKVMTNQACENVFGPTRIISSTLCLNSTLGVSTCYGDSGGPVVLKTADPITYTLVGLSSFLASDGCTLGYPSGSTRITSFVRWIKQETGIFYE